MAVCAPNKGRTGAKLCENLFLMILCISLFVFEKFIWAFEGRIENLLLISESELVSFLVFFKGVNDIRVKFASEIIKHNIIHASSPEPSASASLLDSQLPER